MDKSEVLAAMIERTNHDINELQAVIRQWVERHPDPVRPNLDGSAANELRSEAAQDLNISIVPRIETIKSRLLEVVCSMYLSIDETISCEPSVGRASGSCEPPMGRKPYTGSPRVLWHDLEPHLSNNHNLLVGIAGLVLLLDDVNGKPILVRIPKGFRAKTEPYTEDTVLSFDFDIYSQVGDSFQKALHKVAAPAESPKSVVVFFGELLDELRDCGA